MSIKRNILKNGFASTLTKGVRMLEQLFLVPFFITAWGAAYYGEWLTLTIIPSVFAFSDLGFGSAAANSFVLAYASNEKQKAANINKAAIRIISIILFISMLISIVVLLMLNHYQVFEKSLIDKQDAIMAVSILILARFLNFYTQLMDSYYRSARRASLSINLKTIKSLLNLGGGMLILLLGYGVVAFSVSQLIIIVFFNLYYWYKGNKLLIGFNDFKGIIDKIEVRNITSKGFGYMLFPAWQSIYFQGTTFVVRVVLGPEAVAVFNTVRTLSRSVNQILNIVSSSIFPELQFEMGAGNKKNAVKIFKLGVISSFILAVLGVLFLAIFGLWFYGVWTQKQLYVEPTMWYVLLIGVLFNALWWSSEPVFRAKNEPYQFALIGVFSAIVSVIVTYVFSKWLGLVGAAMGAVVLDIIMALIIIPKSIRLMEMNFRDLYKGLNIVLVFQKLLKK
jgi:O-antigen/teichoic acid export membrane protein